MVAHSAHSDPAISILMPCYNRAYDLGRVLRAYDSQVVDEPFELIAVDDASTDETYDLLRAFQPQRYTLRVERQAKNAGPAAARNRALELARAPLVLIVGDDILPDPHLLRGHLAAHRRYPDPGQAILGRVRWPADLPVNTLMAHIDGIGAQQFSYHYLQNEQEYDFRHLYTANVSLKLGFLRLEAERGGRLFDTDFNYAAFEDAELAYRLSRRGLRIRYVASLLGDHYHYHNIWTFSTRQYRMGLMATVMLRKHPELRGRLVGRRWPWQAYLWALRGAGAPETHAQQLARAGRLESEILMALSTHEWPGQGGSPISAAALDTLYLGVLNYFYYKGLVHGTFAQRNGWLSAARLAAVLAQRRLGGLKGYLQ